MFNVSRLKTLRNKHLNALAEKLFAPIVKQLLSLLVDKDDLALDIHNDDAVGRRLQQAAKLRLRSLGLGPGKLLPF